MTEMMKAVVLTGHGGLDKLVYQEVPIPTPGPDDVLIKINTTGIAGMGEKQDLGQITE